MPPYITLCTKVQFLKLNTRGRQATLSLMYGYNKRLKQSTAVTNNLQVIEFVARSFTITIIQFVFVHILLHFVAQVVQGALTTSALIYPVVYAVLADALAAPIVEPSVAAGTHGLATSFTLHPIHAPFEDSHCAVEGDYVAFYRGYFLFGAF